MLAGLEKGVVAAEEECKAFSEQQPVAMASDNRERPK